MLVIRRILTLPFLLQERAEIWHRILTTLLNSPDNQILQIQRKSQSLKQSTTEELERLTKEAEEVYKSCSENSAFLADRQKAGREESVESSRPIISSLDNSTSGRGRAKGNIRNDKMKETDTGNDDAQNPNHSSERGDSPVYPSGKIKDMYLVSTDGLKIMIARSIWKKLLEESQGLQRSCMRNWHRRLLQDAYTQREKGVSEASQMLIKAGQDANRQLVELFNKKMKALKETNAALKEDNRRLEEELEKAKGMSLDGYQEVQQLRVENSSLKDKPDIRSHDQLQMIMALQAENAQLKEEMDAFRAQCVEAQALGAEVELQLMAIGSEKAAISPQTVQTSPLSPGLSYYIREQSVAKSIATPISRPQEANRDYFKNIGPTTRCDQL